MLIYCLFVLSEAVLIIVVVIDKDSSGTGVYTKYVRIPSTAQRSNWDAQQFFCSTLRHIQSTPLLAKTSAIFTLLSASKSSWDIKGKRALATPNAIISSPKIVA